MSLLRFGVRTIARTQHSIAKQQQTHARFWRDVYVKDRSVWSASIHRLVSICIRNRVKSVLLLRWLKTQRALSRYWMARYRMVELTGVRWLGCTHTGLEQRPITIRRARMCLYDGARFTCFAKLMYLEAFREFNLHLACCWRVCFTFNLLLEGLGYMVQHAVEKWIVKWVWRSICTQAEPFALLFRNPGSMSRFTFVSNAEPLRCNAVLRARIL